jgi:type IV pilus assembly protein PilM
MFFKSKKIIGLDIGTSSVKLAEIELSRSGASLLSYAMAPTPSASISGGEISNPGAISATIQSLIAQTRTKTKNVATGMWGTAVIVKKITVPAVEENMLAEQVRWEAEQYIPFDINEISLSFHLLKSFSNAETMDLLLIAAQNELVFQYTSTIEEAGLKASILDVSSFALANCFEFNYGKRNGETIGVLNIGAGVTNFAVIHNGDLIFSRDIPVGGANYSNEIHKELAISIADAEALKLSAAGQGEVPDEVHSIISATNDVVAEEIRNSFDFFAATSGGLTLNRVYYTGGGTLTPGLIEGLGRSTGIEFELFNPFINIKSGNKSFNEVFLSQIAPYASVVLGLALRQVGDSD